MICSLICCCFFFFLVIHELFNKSVDMKKHIMAKSFEPPHISHFCILLPCLFIKMFKQCSLRFVRVYVHIETKALSTHQVLFVCIHLKLVLTAPMLLA